MKAHYIALAAAAAALVSAAALSAAVAEKAKCPVSGKEVEVAAKTPKVYVQGKAQYFCCENCPKAFAKTPEKFVKTVGSCPILGGDVNAAGADERKVVNNGLWYVCCPGCIDGVENSTVVLKELEDVVSGKKFKATASSPNMKYRDQFYYFENAQTKAAFEKEPAKYAVVFGR